MGLLEAILGKENPLAQWAGQNQNFLGAIGGGLGQGQNIQSGLSAGLAQVPQAKALDYQANEQRKADEKVLAQTNAGVLSLRQKYPDLADAVEGGSLPVSDAWNEAFKRMSDARTAGGTSGGPYAGTGMDAQNWNILLAGDPSTPEYAAAWTQVTAPKMTLQQTADGLMPVYQTPTIPDSIRRPVGMASTGAPVGGGVPAGGQGAPTAAAAPAVGPGGVSTGATLPGTQAKPTEAQLRNSSIATVLASEIPKVGNNFSALTDPKGQLLSVLGPAGNPWQSSEYQQAATALGSSVSQILYSLSGATANPGEVQKQIAFLTPAWGDKPAVIADKMDRFKTLVRAVANSSGDQEIIKSVEDAIANLGIGGSTGAGAAPVPSTKYPGVTITKVQ